MNPKKPQYLYLDQNTKNDNNWATSAFPNKRHAGSIIESIIRKRGHNLSKLAKHMNISRCTLYNWFEHEILPLDVLLKIGSFIDYDFSNEFPEVFAFMAEKKTNIHLQESEATPQTDVNHWMHKYILLLEKYNKSLMSKEYHSSKLDTL